MKRTLTVAVALGLVAALAGCGERTQSASGRKSDAKPWQGAADPYVASGWKAGDKASWDEQIRIRAQTQNEYARVR